MNKIFKKSALGVTALVTSIMLVACGQQSTTSGQLAHHTSSALSAKGESTKVYHSANQLIKKGEYQKAYSTLNRVSHQSKQVSDLSSDLHNYINAKNSYSNGNYNDAANSLNTPRSKSQPMYNAYNELQGKISNAKKVASTSNSSTNQSNNIASTSSSSSNFTVSQSSAVNNFANKMNFNKNESYSIIPRSQNGDNYEFEVRQNNNNNTVANMVGIYHYNDQTKTATKVQ